MTVSGAIPLIETARLRLRAPGAGDFAVVAPFLASDRARFIGGPHDRDRAWAKFAASAGAWVLQGFGYWALEERASGRIAGAVGFQHPPAFAEKELGWGLHDGFEGRGYATEAAAAARDWWFRARGETTLVSYIDRGNARSIRVAERLGARRDSAATGPDPEDLVFRHPRPEIRP